VEEHPIGDIKIVFESVEKHGMIELTTRENPYQHIKGDQRERRRKGNERAGG
jgi:hypothetical protein